MYPRNCTIRAGYFFCLCGYRADKSNRDNKCPTCKRCLKWKCLTCDKCFTGTYKSKHKCITPAQPYFLPEATMEDIINENEDNDNMNMEIQMDTIMTEEEENNYRQTDNRVALYIPYAPETHPYALLGCSREGIIIATTEENPLPKAAGLVMYINPYVSFTRSVLAGHAQGSENIFWLFNAIQQGFSDIVEVLCLGGVKLNETYDTYGLTPLHVAAQKGNINIIRILIHHNAPLDTPDLHDNNTPLHTAFLNNNDNAAIVIMGKGASSEIFNKSGLTPLMIATAKTQKSPNQVCTSVLSVGTISVKSRDVFLPNSFQQLVMDPSLILPSLGFPPIPTSFDPNLARLQNNLLSYQRDKQIDELVAQMTISSNMRCYGLARPPKELASIVRGDCKRLTF